MLGKGQRSLATATARHTLLIASPMSLCQHNDFGTMHIKNDLTCRTADAWADTNSSRLK